MIKPLDLRAHFSVPESRHGTTTAFLSVRLQYVSAVTAMMELKFPHASRIFSCISTKTYVTSGTLYDVIQSCWLEFD